MGFPILFSTVSIPILVSAVLPLIKDKKGELYTAISSMLLAYPLVALTWIMVQKGFGQPFIDPVFLHSDRAGDFSMILDGLNAPIAYSIALVTLMVSIYSLRYMKHRFGEMKAEGEKPQSWGTYYMLYVMFSSAMLGTVMSTNLIEFYLFLELSLLPSFLLIAFFGYGEKAKIAIMYLIWTHVGALVFLGGAMVLGLNTGVFNMVDQAGNAYIGLGEQLSANLRMPVLIALTLGLFVKMAVFGVHIWLPYAQPPAVYWRPTLLFSTEYSEG